MTVTPAQIAARQRAVKTTLISTALLALVKLATAITTGSLSVMASFLDSVMDLFASTVNAVALRIAERPADADHAYGHGKAESLAGLFQGAVVGLSGLGLLAESVRRLVVRDDVIEHSQWAIAVMALSVGVTIFIVLQLRAAIRTANSPALRAESVHYASDLLVNGAAIGVLSVQYFTGLNWPDAAVSGLVSLYLLKAGWGIFRESIDGLMDREVEGEDMAEAIAEILVPMPDVYGFHSLRARRSGALKFIDLHLDLDRGLSFERAHELTEQAIVAIEGGIEGASVWIHADPYPPDSGELVDDASINRYLLHEPTP